MTNIKPKIVLGGIDGTGDFWNRKYAKVFSKSHVNTLYKEWTHGPSHYRRGPWWEGSWTVVEAYRIFRKVRQDWKDGADAIFLAGYSRGGAAVIEIAKWLKQENIPVECLILLDPVDRSRTMGDDMWKWKDTAIVDTVKSVIYAQRQAITKSRESFGNCGKTYENRGKTTLYFNSFFATHGGLGGVPWTEPKEGFINEGFPDFETRVTAEADQFGSEKVKRWAFNLVFDVLYDCLQRLTPPSIPKQPGRGIPLPGGNQRIYIVKPGDWLSKIALAYYGDASKWTKIYDVPANKKEIGTNPDLIEPGMRLQIP